MTPDRNRRRETESCALAPTDAAEPPPLLNPRSRARPTCLLRALIHPSTPLAPRAPTRESITVHRRSSVLTLQGVTEPVGRPVLYDAVIIGALRSSSLCSCACVRVCAYVDELRINFGVVGRQWPCSSCSAESVVSDAVSPSPKGVNPFSSPPSLTATCLSWCATTL